MAFKHLILDDVLDGKHPNALKGLKKQCKTESSLEIIKWLELSPPKMSKHHAEYIAEGSTNEINISFKTRDSMQQAFDDGDEAAWDELAATADDEMMSVLRGNAWSRYKRTEDYYKIALDSRIGKAMTLLGVDTSVKKDAFLEFLAKFYTSSKFNKKTFDKLWGKHLKKIAPIDLEFAQIKKNLESQGSWPDDA